MRGVNRNSISHRIDCPPRVTPLQICAKKSALRTDHTSKYCSLHRAFTHVLHLKEFLLHGNVIRSTNTTGGDGITLSRMCLIYSRICRVVLQIVTLANSNIRCTTCSTSNSYLVTQSTGKLLLICKLWISLLVGLTNLLTYRHVIMLSSVF